MKDTITFADFQKLDFQVGTIISAERLENSDKMIKMQIDLGEEKRQILAGLGKDYNIDELIGKQLVVLVNLMPKKIMGEKSQGMLLAADIGGKPVIISPESTVSSGTTVR